MHDLVILTGHSSGLGSAILEQLLQSQFRVIALARRQLNLAHSGLLEITCDFSQSIEETIKKLRDLIESEANTIRSITLINNAGSSGPVGLIGKINAEAMTHSVAVNALAPMQLMNLLASYQVQYKIGLIQISSGAAHKSYPGWMVYCSCKAAVRMSAQVLAMEADLSGSGLRVLIYEPGILDTPMQTELRAVGKDRFPRLDRFTNLYKEGQLVAPQDSARQLLKLWQNSARPSFEELRYDPNLRL